MNYNIFKIMILLPLSFAAIQQMEAQNIQFTTGSWESVLAKAKAEHKLVFVDIYAVWCGPCKGMAKNVFTQKAVAGEFNAKFINFEVDAEKGEGVDLAKKYEVGSFPTYLFVDPAGKLVYKIEGAREADKFIVEAKKAEQLYGGKD